MTKRIKRTGDFEITLEITNDDFIRPPQDFQRRSLLNSALTEFSDNLNALDKTASGFVAGNTKVSFEDRTQKELTDREIMEDWQIPVIQLMADSITATHGEILEIGFGNGISSTMIQKRKVRSHTIIECNDFVIRKFHKWKLDFDTESIRLVRGLWQETIDDLGLFDGIFFHTYPLNEEEYMKYVQGRVTFAEHFFETAARHLKPKGTFTYFSNEIDSLSRQHQRSLFKHFSSISLQTVNLELPEDVEDTWWADSIVVVKAVR